MFEMNICLKILLVKKQSFLLNIDKSYLFKINCPELVAIKIKNMKCKLSIVDYRTAKKRTNVQEKAILNLRFFYKYQLNAECDEV